MLAVERHRLIQELLNEKGQITTNELCQRLSASPATIRNDLNKLSELHLLQKTHGGAVSCFPSGKNASDPGLQPINTLSFKSRENVNSRQKEAISEAALSYIQDNQCILLDASSTALALARKLHRFNKLMVITNGIYTMLTLKEVPNITVILIGGIITKNSGSVEGVLGIDLLNHLHIDQAFVSAYGFTPEEGLTDFNVYEVELKRAMMKSCKNVIALLDSSKFETNSAASFIPTEEINTILTDDGLDEELLKKYQQQGINIKISPTK